MSRESVNEFVYGKLLPSIFLGETRDVINLEKAFKGFLIEKSLFVGKEDEVVERFSREISEKLIKRLEDFERLGIPKFIGEVEDNKGTYLTWSHAKFKEETGLEGLPKDFCTILNWIDSLSSREFLIVCVIALKIIGADPIFITDSPGDEGIDCIGLVKDGALRSTALFVQSKTSEDDDISRDTLLMEYGKYLSLPHTKKYIEYRKALRFDTFLDGSSNLYMFFANAEFKPAAREISRNIGILLRSRLQLTLWISLRISHEKVIEIYEKLRIDLRADVTKNIAPLVDI